jgi:ParB-like chromosome segregation protein Spo0J
MKVELMSIEKLVPYARNPRITAHAVDKVAASIKEFGFRQPTQMLLPAYLPS